MKSTKQQFQQRVDELVNEWKEDVDKVMSAFSVVSDNIINDYGNEAYGDNRESFAVLIDSEAYEAIGITIYRLIVKDMEEDAREEIKQEMEKDLDASRGYYSPDRSESDQVMEDAGHKPGDF